MSTEVVSSTTPGPAPYERVAPWFLLLGTLLSGVGLTWDVQWHTDVGPDTFLTAPHLVMYLGMAVSGITSLTAVLIATRLHRRSEPSEHGPALDVLGTFRTPLPYLLCGVGAAGGLIYGLADLWWHEVYGFDVTPTSPPHVALSLMSVFDTAGLMLAFILLRHTRPGRIGLPIAAAATVPNLVFLCLSTPGLPGVEGVTVGTSVTITVVIAALAGARRQATPLLIMAAAALVLQGVLWLIAPVLTSAYADFVELPMRDNAVGVPVMPFLMPIALPLAALLFVAVLRLGAARAWPPRIAVPVTAALAAMIMGLGYWPLYQWAAPTLLALAVLGGLAGWIGWQLGSLGRQRSEGPSVPDPSTPAAPPIPSRLAGNEG